MDRRRTALPRLALLTALVTGAAATGCSSPEGRATVGDRAGFSPGGSLHQLDDAELAADLDAVQDSGAAWVRLDVAWSRLEPVRGQRVWAETDRLVAAAAERDLKVLGLLAYTPAWARPGCDTDKCPPRVPQEFADFAAAAVERYGPERVQAWEVWNEPNVHGFWAPSPDIEAYSDLLSATVTAVRAVRPAAFVVSAGLSPAVSDGRDVAPLEAARTLYDLGALTGVDAVGIHPYSATTLPLTPGTEEWNTFLQMERLHDLMTARGDGDKPVWATEFGVSTGDDPRSTDESQQAAILQQGFGRFADGTWPWLGTLFAYSVRDRADDPSDWQSGFGLLRHDRSPKPAYGAVREVLALCPGAQREPERVVA